MDVFVPCLTLLDLGRQVLKDLLQVVLPAFVDLPIQKDLQRLNIGLVKGFIGGCLEVGFDANAFPVRFCNWRD